MSSLQLSPADTSSQRWAWWPLLPLYPYGRRPTLMRELVPNRVWCFEQLHGVWYVAVPIRMSVVKVDGGLMLYSPLAATEEVIRGIHALENAHGPVLSIVLATSSGLEHKLPVPALCRAFPRAALWVSDRQWSFPLQLPSSWLGFPADRTKILFRDGLPHPDQLSWIPLGPINLGLGTFNEVACLDHDSGSLLVTDALVSISSDPPPIFALDPTPLLFHSRQNGSERLTDTPSNRLNGWKRIVLFANFFKPVSVQVTSLHQSIGHMFGPFCRNRRSHFGFYPVQWSEDWEAEFDSLFSSGRCVQPDLMLSPVLERLVFPRHKEMFISWLRELSNYHDIKSLISCHYHAPMRITSIQLDAYAESLTGRDWARSEKSWTTLASIDQFLLRLGIVPPQA
jgi:hypothetical protein